MKKNKRVSKIKKSLKKYEEDLINYQNSLTQQRTQNSTKELNEYVTVDEVSDEEEVKKELPHNEDFLIFSHSYLNEQKTHLRSVVHPQKVYNSMKIRK